MQHLNAACGYYFLPIMPHFLYNMLGSWMIRILPGDPFILLSLFSALCGAASVALFYHLMERLIRYDRRGQDVSPEADKAAVRFGAVVSSILLIIALPMWFSATRPLANTFDLMLLLTSLSLLLRYSREDAGQGWFLGAVFVFGLGITEYPSMAALAPLFIMTGIYFLWRRGRFTFGAIWPAVAVGLLGLSFYFAPIIAMRNVPDLGYGEYDNQWLVWLDLLRKQFREFKEGFPQIGGLLLILFTLVPWCYVLFIPKSPRTFHARPINLTTLTLLVLNILGLMLLTERWFSPMMIVGGIERTILPYLLIASWAGYLAGYWRLRARMAADPFSFGSFRWLWVTMVVVNLAAAPVIAAIQFQRFNPLEKSALATFARNTIQSCEERPLFFISGGFMDDMLIYLAKEKDPAHQIVISPLLNKPSVRRYLAAQFPEAELDDPKMSNQECVKAMVAGNAEGPESCAFSYPDMAQSIGYQALPNGLVVFPVDDLKPVDPEKLEEKNREMMDGLFAAQIQEMTVATNNPARNFLLKEYSRCQNNVGVTLRLLKRDDLARSAFEKALEILPQNPSVLVNLRDIYLSAAAELPVKSAERTKLNGRARELLEQAFEEGKRLGPAFQDPMVLSSQFGTLYSAYFNVLLAQRSRALGLSDLEETAVEQAELINPDNPMVRNSSALFSFGRGDLDKAAGTYRSLLDEDPLNVSARIGLAAIAYSRDNKAGALSVLEAEDAPTNSSDIIGFRTLIYLEQGDQTRGAWLYNETAAISNRSALSAAFLALSAFKLEKYQDAEKHGAAALAAAPNNLPVLQMMYDVARQTGNQEQILPRLERLYRADPNNRATLERLVFAYLQKGDTVRAKGVADALVELEADSIVAHMALASLAQLPETREKHLRICIRDKNHWVYDKALNNLAYALFQMNRSEEALPLALEAVTLAPSNDKYHHTLASIYLANGDLQKAEEQILLASTLAPADGNHKVLLAEIHVAKGDLFKARELASAAMPVLTGEWRERALAIIKQVQ